MNRKNIAIASGIVLTIALIVAALWGWQRAETLVTLIGLEKRKIGAWAIRSAAVALIALAEAVLLALVVERAYRPDALSGLAKLSALFVLMVSAVSAIALGLAGR